MANPSKRDDGHVYYVIGGETRRDLDFIYKRAGEKYYLDAGVNGELNLIGKHVYINGIDMSNVMIGDIKEYAKKTDVTKAINDKFTEISKTFNITDEGSVWIKSFYDNVKKLPCSGYTSIKAITRKINVILKNLGSKCGVIDDTAPDLTGDSIEKIEKMFFLKVDKTVVTFPEENVKYYVKSGDDYVVGGTTPEGEWVEGVDVYTNSTPSDFEADDIEWSEIDIVEHLCKIDDKINEIVDKINEFIG